MVKKPQKLECVLDVIKQHIREDRYTVTTHALTRQKERKINIAEVLHVLKTGYEEKRKTCFDEINKTWKYAIRGKTKINDSDVRVIVAFDEAHMLIITVMYVGRL